MAFKGAWIGMTASTSGVNYTALTTMAWDTELYDTDSWHDNVTNNSRLTVPAGVSYVNVYGQLLHEGMGAGQAKSRIEIYKNGAVISPALAFNSQNGSGTSVPGYQVAGYMLPVVAGDYFEMRLQSIGGDATTGINKDYSWFAVEAIAVPQPTFSGALVTHSVDVNAVNMSAGVTPDWDTEVYDVGGWHDTAVNPSRFTIPSGVTYIRLKGQVHTNAQANNTVLTPCLYKNGTDLAKGIRCTMNAGSSTAVHYVQVFSPVLPVIAGDYFTMFIFDTDTSVDRIAAGTWFSIEKVE